MYTDIIFILIYFIFGSIILHYIYIPNSILIILSILNIILFVVLFIFLYIDSMKELNLFYKYPPIRIIFSILTFLTIGTMPFVIHLILSNVGEILYKLKEMI